MYQPRHAWNSFWCRQFFAQNMALQFFISGCFTLAWEYFTTTSWIFTQLYMLSSFTFWKRHHVAVNTLICFTCHAVSGFHLAAVFYRWYELLKFENIVSPYFEFRFHPMKWPLIFQSLWFSQPGFSSGNLNCNFQFKLRFLHLLPSLTVWDDKNKYPFDCDKALQYPEVVTPNTWEANQHFLRRECFLWFAVSPNNSAYQFSSSFAARCVGRVFICPKSGLKIQLHQPFCPSILWTGSFFHRADQLLATRHV